MTNDFSTTFKDFLDISAKPLPAWILAALNAAEATDPDPAGWCAVHLAQGGLIG